MILSYTVEIWLPIEGYEGICAISSFGRFRTFDRYSGHNKGTGSPMFIKGTIHNRVGNKKDYYIRQRLSKGGRLKYKQLHILVAEHFIPNPQNKKTVNHKDGNKRNNAWWNLEWNTYLENNQHAKIMGLNPTRGQTHHWATLNNEQVLEIIKSEKTTKELASIYGVDEASITGIKRGKSWGHLTGIIYKKHHRKLNQEEVIRIFLSNKTTGELSKEYGVTREAIRCIKNGTSHLKLTQTVKNQSI